MSNENRLKVAVPRRMFLWSLNESSGEIITHVGPTEFTPSANDRVVRSNNRGGFEQPPTMESRPFIIAREGEYVILQNPVRGEHPDEYPNGNFVAGANKEKDLLLGSTKIVSGPCGFPLWPGQSAEVRTAHKLGANHYLLVEVVGPLDEKARYAKLVIESAGLSSAVIDSGEESAGVVSPRVELSGAPRQLQIGQRIVIQGRHTQLFIPPTGIEIVPPIEDMDIQTKSQEDGITQLSPQVAQECAKLVGSVRDGLTAKQFSILKNEIRHRQDLSTHERAIILTALDEAFDEKGSGGQRNERKSRAGRDRDKVPADPYARRAVLLGPKEFCFLFDADGHARVVRGPARVFPGPYDAFMTRGSRRRVYDAYELAEHQALWLRIISPIPRGQLEKYLPPEYPLDRDIYEPGHEMIVRGKPTVFFPFIEAEILNPNTHEPHVGNDHENAIIDAIGVEQKSGIYVRDLRTGAVKMVRGQTSYLVDPRSEEQVQRRIPREQWNLIVGHAEPHKIVPSTGESFVSTPWALSVTVPNNEAVLVTSPHGRRVEPGPKVIWLEYDESLTTLKLSKGPSKDGHSQVSTCFLRVQGGRVADSFEVESADFVKLKVRVGFSGHFEGEPVRWFNVEDPIKLLADTVRARVREAAALEPATKLLKSLPQLVRAQVLREGNPLRFEENGMVIDGVDVLSVGIVDPGLSGLFQSVQTESVKLQLKGEEATRRLSALQQQSAIEAQENLLREEAAKRRAQSGVFEAEAAHKVEIATLQLQSERQSYQQDQKRRQEQAQLEFTIQAQRQKADTDARNRQLSAEAEAKAQATLHEVDEKHKSAVAIIDRELARGLAEADAIKLQAVQRELVGALQAASDSEVMKAAAQNMNLVSLLGGKSPAELFSQLLKGTPLARSVVEMQERAPKDDKKK
jgi:hypothetical protein